MGLILLILLVGLETAYLILTLKRERVNTIIRKRRLVFRLAEMGVLMIAVLLPFGQKWRLFPVFTFLLGLSVFALIIFLIKRNRVGELKKTSGIIVSYVLCILCFVFLLIPAFLFTGYKGLPVSGRYHIGETSAILIDDSRIDPYSQDGSQREVPVHFYYPLTDDNHKEEYPLVLFSHGAFGYYQSNTSTYMELASNGYVVASLDHPHQAFFTKDSRGKTVIVDNNFLNTALTLDSVTDPEEQYNLYVQWMELRTGDMNFVLDEVKKACEAGKSGTSWVVSGRDTEQIQAVLEITDISRIGLMGHSMGGATAVELGRQRSDISAVIDIDGTMLGEYTGFENQELLIRDEAYTVPILEFNNWESYLELKEHIRQGGSYPNEVLISGASEGFTTTIRGTKHMDFTDLPLLSPILGKMLGSGERSTQETMSIVNKTVLTFFNCYLKGDGVFSVQESY